MGESYGYTGEFVSNPLTPEQAQALYFKVLELVVYTTKWNEFPVAVRPLTASTSCIVIGKPEPRGKQRYDRVQKSLQYIMDSTKSDSITWSGTMKWSGTGCEGDGYLTVKDGVVECEKESYKDFCRRMMEFEDEYSGTVVPDEMRAEILADISEHRSAAGTITVKAKSVIYNR